MNTEQGQVSLALAQKGENHSNIDPKLYLHNLKHIFTQFVPVF